MFLAYRIDATEDDGSYGRLINDDHLNPNLKVVTLKVAGRTHPVFFTKKTVLVGEELTYSYGGPNQNYPWRQHGKA